MSAGSSVEALAATAILIVGAPRSGTTWLAKIFDSHPATLYRHEPDEIVPARDTIQDKDAKSIQKQAAVARVIPIRSVIRSVSG